MDSLLHWDADRCDRVYCNLSDRPLVFDPAQLHSGGHQARLRVILVGYPEDVNREILNLYHCGYDIEAWSPPQRIPGSDEVVSIYAKRSDRLEG